MILVKADRHPALALVDPQTQEGALVYCRFIQHYHILTRLSEKKTLSTLIKGLQRTIDEEYTLQLGWIEHLEERTCYVAQFSRWDMILEELCLTAANAQILASNKLNTIQPPKMQLFPLSMW